MPSAARPCLNESNCELDPHYTPHTSLAGLLFSIRSARFEASENRRLCV